MTEDTELKKPHERKQPGSELLKDAEFMRGFYQQCHTYKLAEAVLKTGVRR